VKLVEKEEKFNALEYASVDTEDAASKLQYLYDNPSELKKYSELAVAHA